MFKNIMNMAQFLGWLQKAIPIFGDHHNEIIPNKVWLGDISTAMDYEWLKAKGITHVVGVLSFDSKDVVFFPSDFFYITVNVHDNTSTNLLKYWPYTTKFMHDALASGGKIYVHCKFGRSRSVATLAAFLIAEYCLHPSQALSMIRSNRKQAAPNSAFVAQLFDWAEHQRRQCENA
jgi:protein-tyrosine phosphatase